MTQFLTCREVAARYGVKIGTVWGWIRNGRLAASRIGKSYRVSQQQIEAFEQQGDSR
jgi:excisionase family DNA binding protein